MGKRQKRFVASIDWDALKDYITDLRDRLELSAWTINLCREPCHRDALAQIERVGYMQEVNLWLCRDWANGTAEEHRATLVHELLHIHLFPIMGYTEVLRSVLCEDARTLAVAAQEHQLEGAVETLTAAIAPLLPLPAAPKGSS